MSLKVCPSLDDLATFLDGALDQAAARTTAAHLALCADCCEIVKRIAPAKVPLGSAWKRALAIWLAERLGVSRARGSSARRVSPRRARS